MKNKSSCEIVSVGRRRDGGTRYWCLRHKADATAKYGVPAHKCRYADVPEIKETEILNIDISEYRGGVALWGAVPPVYDTTRLPLDRGIHVHARRNPGDLKEIDETFRAVRITDKNRPDKTALVSELDAIYYMVSSIFGYPMKNVECTRCGHPHLDRDWFSLHPHQRHLCAGCGQYFRDIEVAVGNPIVKTQQLFDNKSKMVKESEEKLDIKQSDFPGGIQIWGSNSAIFWTSEQNEEKGIHLHAFLSDTDKPEIDGTFSEVIVDGIKLDSSMVRTLMAQNAIPHIKGRVISFNCPDCSKPHFSEGTGSFTPSKTHTCAFCGKDFLSKGRLRNVIGNPLPKIIDQLAETAVRAPQIHDIQLLPETL